MRRRARRYCGGPFYEWKKEWWKMVYNVER